MGLNIQIKSANFTNYIGSVTIDPVIAEIPFLEDLVGYWNFNRKLSDAAKNIVTGVSSTIVGAPIIDAGKITLNNHNGLITNLATATQKTIITVSKSSTTAPLMATHDYNTNTIASDGLFILNSNIYMRRAMTYNDFNSGKASTYTEPHFYAASMSNNKALLSFSALGVLDHTAKTETKTVTYDTRPLKLGAWNTENSDPLGRTSDTYVAMVYDRALTEVELDSVYSYLKTVLPFLSNQ